MAEAFAKIHGAPIVNACSAGSRPSGNINPKAIEAMKQKGYDLTVHHSKSLLEIPQVIFEYAITMGCGDECPFVRAKHRQDWNIPDPKHMPPAEFNVVRDTIAQKVTELIDTLRK